METKNFRVHYQISGIQYQIDFSIINGPINEETLNISAWHKIKISHANVKREDVQNIKIEKNL
jgi:hypothetical protein